MEALSRTVCQAPYPAPWGLTFLADTFDALLPLAASRGLRLVLVSRRDYPGSTPYTDEDLREIRSGSRHFLEKLGRELLHLMVWFVKEYNLPRVSNLGGKLVGGVALLGWSMAGTTQALSLCVG